MLLCALAGCRDAQPRDWVDDGTADKYPLHGVIIHLDSAKHIATIKHGKIANAAGKIWMDAMTMDFPAPKREDWNKLHKGDEISATLVSRQSDYQYWIEDVH